MKLTSKQIDVLNDATAKLTAFKKTWAFNIYYILPHQTILLSTGNQFQKTASTAYSYVMRCFGYHPVAKKNATYYECETRQRWCNKEIAIEEYLNTHKNKDLYPYLAKLTKRYMQPYDIATWNIQQLPKDMKCPECGGNIVMHKRNSKVIRFASETLPGQFEGNKKKTDDAGETKEVKNTQYPEFKKWMPQYLLIKDITARNVAMTLKDIQGGENIIIDMVSYNQSVQSTAGSQRISFWGDEQGPENFLEEQKPRLLAEDGDIIITNTPADSLSYLYDDVYEKANLYVRTKTIADKFNLKQLEGTKSPYSIAVIQAATDDNPTLSKEIIDHMFENEDDPDRLLIRRYGIFKQISGRIFKSFDWGVHVQNLEKYFPKGIPIELYNHFRLIDYHQHNNWACIDVSISPMNEAFVWIEMNPDPENRITFDIIKDFALMTREYKFILNLIDPLAAIKQSNTGMTTIEDINRAFNTFAKEGWAKPAFWQAWDTKSTKGREAVRERLMNSVKVGKPFNNEVIIDGIKKILPTLWIGSNCPLMAKSLKNWRLEEWANNAMSTTKDSKEKPQQKFSHFCTALECLFKHPMARPKVLSYNQYQQKDYGYFKGAVHA